MTTTPPTEPVDAPPEAPPPAEPGSAVPAPGSFRAWILASRPPTLVAAVVPVLIGAACAAALSGFRWGPTLGALLAALWLQIGANFSNDLFDFEKGADTGERLGPTRAVQAGLLTPAAMRRGTAVAFAAAALCGLYLTWVGGWPMLVLGVAAILSALAYTAGPYPLGYHGLGDLFVLLFFGFAAVCGTAYVNLGEVPSIAWWAALPPGVLATNLLVVNNLRDRHTDRRAGKGTLVARLGRRAGIAEYTLMLAVAHLVPLGLFWTGAAGLPILLPLITLPRSALLFGQVTELEGRDLNRTLGGTARLLVLHGLLFAAGIVFGVPMVR